MMNAPRTLAVAALLAALTVPVSAQKSVVDARLGIEVKPPKGWTQLPAGVDRGQCVMWFAGPRALTPKNRGATHTPLMRVLFFQKGLSEDGDEVDGLPRLTPFRNFDDYVARGLGKDARVTSRAVGKAGNLEGRRFVVEVTSEFGSRTVFGIAVPRDDGELVVACEVLSVHVGKERKAIERALGDLAIVETEAETEAPICRRNKGSFRRTQQNPTRDQTKNDGAGSENER